MPMPRHRLGAVVVNGEIWLVGGAKKPSGVDSGNVAESFGPGGSTPYNSIVRSPRNSHSQRLERHKPDPNLDFVAVATIVRRKSGNVLAQIVPSLAVASCRCAPSNRGIRI